MYHIVQRLVKTSLIFDLLLWQRVIESKWVVLGVLGFINVTKVLRRVLI